MHACKLFPLFVVLIDDAQQQNALHVKEIVTVIVQCSKTMNDLLEMCFIHILSHWTLHI